MYVPYKLQFTEEFCTDIYHSKLHTHRLSQKDLIFKCKKYVGKLTPVIQLTTRECTDKDALVVVKCILLNTLHQLEESRTLLPPYDPSVDVILLALLDFKNGTITFSYAFPYRKPSEVDVTSLKNYEPDPDLVIKDYTVNKNGCDPGLKKKINDRLYESPSSHPVIVRVIKNAVLGQPKKTSVYRVPLNVEWTTECTFSEPFTYTLNKASVIDSVVSLNLHLAKWRYAPRMDLDSMKKQTVLILGIGSLGCHVIRTLLAYGVRKFILVDNGTISPSTVLRQLFYERSDISKKKVHVAKEKILSIVESAEVTAYDVTIPIFQTRDSLKETIARIEVLNTIVTQSDAIFLLTDNRESRWLPTVLGKLHGKRTFTCAIGFDTFVCIEHSAERGCYFCNDVIMPRNTNAFLTEDQRCTVSLPGMSGIAGGIISEIWATPFVDPEEEPRSMHIRSLHGLEIVRMVTHRNELCVACGDHVNVVEKDGLLDSEKIHQILQKPNVLEIPDEDCREILSGDESDT